MQALVIASAVGVIGYVMYVTLYDDSAAGGVAENKDASSAFASASEIPKGAFGSLDGGTSRIDSSKIDPSTIAVDPAGTGLFDNLVSLIGASASAAPVETSPDGYFTGGSASFDEKAGAETAFGGGGGTDNAPKPGGTDSSAADAGVKVVPAPKPPDSAPKKISVAKQKPKPKPLNIFQLLTRIGR